MNFQESVNNWENFSKLDGSLRQELNELTVQEKKEFFYRDVPFGTGGMREKMGVGTNRLNIYTIRRATLGLANHIKTLTCKNNAVVVIAYDTRDNSQIFAEESARVLSNSGIKVLIGSKPLSTPVLSFAVRETKAQFGIVITASHNSAEYNGYKIYNNQGCQLVPNEVAPIISEITKINNYLSLEYPPFGQLIKQKKVSYISKQVVEKYIRLISSLVDQQADFSNIKIVFTPLHGTSSSLMPNILNKAGFENVSFVKSQMVQDSKFSTVKLPNPESHEALNLAITQATNEDADLVLATDPDSDRLGVAVRNGDSIVTLSGNELGVLLLDYWMKKEHDNNPMFLTTVVTSMLGVKIAQNNNIATHQVLTGFKYIGEKIDEYESKNTYNFLFGCEESYGYLLSKIVRDKDAYQPAVVISEMVSEYKKCGLTPLDRLHQLYAEYGFYQNSLKSWKFEGADGPESMSKVLSKFRLKKSFNYASELSVVEDFLTSTSEEINTGNKSIINLPKSDVLKFTFKDGSWFAIRPSGTEPKLKVYFETVSMSSELKVHTKMDDLIRELNMLLSEKVR